jgi:hypothetical protein
LQTEPGEAESQQTYPSGTRAFVPAKAAGVKPVLFTFLLYCGWRPRWGVGSSFLINVKGLMREARDVSLFLRGHHAGRFLSGFITEGE